MTAAFRGSTHPFPAEAARTQSVEEPDSHAARDALFLFFRIKWWAYKDSNLGPIGYEPTALTAEL